ncbi:MAG: autotransporter domain-containing protein [Xanthomonadales bacterium]|nr:hypothetical protein [Xanthomonadales bacterium]MCC6591910.1 autotransporter domain-containing protein [Xanthomonadales bacterium]MCE7930052.1 DUF11 domain-containing protein [Xanthomonadales bacterium PRO6]
MPLSARFARRALVQLARAATLAAVATAALAQEGNVFPPTLSYAPMPGMPVNLTGVTNVGSTGSGQILVTPMGGMGSGSIATVGLGCTILGAEAGFFNANPLNQSFTPTSAPNPISLSCVAGASPRTATLSCNESPAGSTGPIRSWPLNCPAGTVPVPPALSFVPTPGTTIVFQPSGGLIGSNASAQIRATPAGGAGTGAPATTRFGQCSLSNESVPGTFSGFQGITLNFIGASTTPQDLNLLAQVRATQVTALLTCQELHGDASAPGANAPEGYPIVRSWPLQVNAGAAPSRLVLQKSASASQVVTDSDFRYTISVRNDGSSTESGLIVSDDVPAGVGVLSAAGAGWNCSVIGNAVDCRRSALVPGASASFDIQVRAPSTPRSIDNIARLTSQSTSTPIVSSATVNVVSRPPANVDLEIVKSDSIDPVQVGSDFTYTLEVRNIGDSAANGVVVTDTLPAGLTLINASGAGFTCAGSTTVTCTLASALAPGASASVLLQVRAPAQAGSISNRATVDSADVDVNATNNADTEATTITTEPPPPPVPQADLSISASAVPPSVLTGQAVELQIGVGNSGPDPAAATTVNGTLSPAFALSDVSGSGWTCSVSGQQFACNRAGLPVNGNAELRAQASIRPGATAVADANLTVSSTTGDPQTANNATRVVVAYQSGGADLAIVKTDSADPVRAAAQFSYTLNVSNLGPEAATGVLVSDTLPAALTFVSASGNGYTCTRTGQAVGCALGGALAAGASAAVTITVRAPTSGQTLSNEGVVSSSSSDRNPANNRSTQQTTVNNRTADDLADLLDPAAVDPASAAAVPVLAAECVDPASALADACREIVRAADEGRTGEVTEALREIAPDEVLAQTLVLREIAATQFFNVDARLNELRRGGGGFSLSGLTVTTGDSTIPLALVGDALQAALGFGEDNGLVSPWGFFVNGNITTGQQDRDLGAGRVGVDYDSRGITAGVDYRLSSRAVVGGALGFASFSSDVNEDSNVDADSVMVTGYGSYYLNDRLYVDSRLSYGSSSLDLSRHIHFALGGSVFDATASGDTDATQFTIASSIGYHLNYGAWSVTPNAGLRFTKSDIDAFDEGDAGAFNVGYGEQSFNSTQFVVGVQVARAVSLSKGVLMPQFDFSLNSQSGDEARADARLLSGSGAGLFRLQEEESDDSYGTAGLGFVYLLGSGRQAFLSYRHTFGNEDFDRGTLNLGGRFEF